MKILQINGTTNTSYKVNRKIEYIVLHYTAGTRSTTGSARNIAYMFKNGGVEGSADFIVDDTEFVQYNGDIKNRFCWAVGGNRYSVKYTSESASHYYKCSNANSISIEMCSTKVDKTRIRNTDTDWYLTDAVVNNAVELTQYLMKIYNVSVDKVIMHHHVTGKCCPLPWCLNNDRLPQWYNFKKRLVDNSQEIINTTVNVSINGNVTTYRTKNVRGNNYIEARKFLEKLGYEVGFNNDKKRVTVDNRLTLDIPTIIENGSSYIHLRETIDFLNKYDTWKFTQDKIIDYKDKVVIIS